MKSNGSMNRVFRVVWNAAKASWQAVSEVASGQGKGTSGKAARLARRGLTLSSFAAGTVLVLALPVQAAPAADALPTGGVVTEGAATISSSGSRMDINQTTQRAAIDWQTFNIGSAAHVHFEQPAGGVALNRVLDTNASQIYGRLTATGQVFLVNPNGVFFAPGAQVDVGGLVASTLNIGNADFMAGNYRFEGTSSNAIFNQGNITAAPGGTIALIAAKVTNDGALTANGGNVLLGAGSKVTLDMGGPVKLQIENDALETLIQNGGAIKADGGVVWLTSQAANNLASSVINNTGLIEAQTLATGEKGEIILFAHGGQANVGGRLDASAPHGGDGGFIETSGSKVVNGSDLYVTTLAPNGQTGTWLIDPLTYTVAASGGDETGAALAGRLASTNIQLQADNTITIDDAVSWSANKLTLTSGGDININANLTASGTGSLAFEYGQASANGAGSSYTVANGVDVLIPNPTAFTWKKGSAGAVNNLVFSNDFLRFGNGTQASINSLGLLLQPFYFDNVTSGRNAWYPLTFSSNPLDVAMGVGGTNNGGWNTTGTVSYTDAGGNVSFTSLGQSINIAKYIEGRGAIVASNTFDFGGAHIKLSHEYSLGQSDKFIKTVTTVENISGSDQANIRVWLGTRDDWIVANDSNYKTKGNIGASGFERIQAQSELGNAILVSEQDPTNSSAEGAAILFYSTTTGTNTLFNNYGNFNTRIVQKDPVTSAISAYHDGSYAIFMNLGDVGNGSSKSLTWYYAAAPVSEINATVNSVAASAGVSTPATTTTTTTTIPQTTAISNVQSTVVPPVVNTTMPSNLISPVAPPPTVVLSNQGALPVFDVNGGLAFVQVSGPAAGNGTTLATGQAVGATDSGSGNVQGSGGNDASAQGNGLPGTGDSGGRDPFGFMRVFVVNGGLNLPDLALGALGQNRQNDANQ